MHTRASLARDLRALGPYGAVLVLHSGFRALGAVEGGPDAVVGALVDALAPEGGTLLTPAFTTQLTDPAHWPVPLAGDERERVLAELPEYDPATTPPHHMGAIATAALRAPGARRSRHPVTSWCAVGPLAQALLDDHPLDDPEGTDGPVGRAWAHDARILLLGVDHDSNTTIHLAESQLDLPHLRILQDRYPTRDAAGARVWRAVEKTTKCSDGFVRIGRHLPPERIGKVGDALARVYRAREVVHVATEVLQADPTALLCDDPDCVHCPSSRRVLAPSA